MTGPPEDGTGAKSADAPDDMSVAGPGDGVAAGFFRTPSRRSLSVILVVALCAVLAVIIWRRDQIPPAPGIAITSEIVRAPRIMGVEFATLPDDDLKLRKSLFFHKLRPIINQENASITFMRQRLLAARAINRNPKWVAGVARAYKQEWSGVEWDALLARVDTVPMELALAQAAKESSWGRSRFAQEGNNLFGMWCYRRGCGLVPEQRDEGKTHEVAVYGSVNQSVRAYMQTINSLRAYRHLRRIRAEIRAAGGEPDALSLVAGLQSYSEQRHVYVDELRALIRANAALMAAPPRLN